MSNREYTWGPGGAAAVARRGVTTTEVIDALYSDQSVPRRLGRDLLIVAGMASTGRVIAVLCQPLAATTRYEILDARPLTAAETDEWRRNL